MVDKPITKSSRSRSPERYEGVVFGCSVRGSVGCSVGVSVSATLTPSLPLCTKAFPEIGWGVRPKSNSIIEKVIQKIVSVIFA